MARLTQDEQYLVITATMGAETIKTIALEALACLQASRPGRAARELRRLIEAADMLADEVARVMTNDEEMLH